MEIKEAYVDFLTAKLLKEKGFNEPTLAYAYGQDMISYYSRPKVTDHLSIEGGRIPLPTQQMAMRYLREVHNWHIAIEKGSLGYHINITSVPNGVVCYITREITGTNYLDTYEEACEEAIKYCLKNLI